MGANSNIEWCDHTFNPWEGCTKVSPGCAHCYAEARNKRFNGGTATNWGKGAPRRRTSIANWNKVIKWNRDASLFLQCTRGCRFQSTVDGLEGFCPKCGDPQADCARPRVFCASLADWLDEEVPIAWLAELLDLIRSTPNLDWLLLTKRPQNFRARLAEVVAMEVSNGPSGTDQCYGIALAAAWLNGAEPSNVWVGTTVEDQQRADERIPELLGIPARVRFLSCEPLLGPVDLASTIWNHTPARTLVPMMKVEDAKTLKSPLIPGIHWVICGGESGPGARPMHPNWARSLRDQCQASAVPFFFKQSGEWYPADTDGETITISTVKSKNQPQARSVENPQWHTFTDGQLMGRIGKKAAGRFLDGVEHSAFPEVAA